MIRVPHRFPINALAPVTAQGGTDGLPFVPVPLHAAAVCTRLFDPYSHSYIAALGKRLGKFQRFAVQTRAVTHVGIYQLEQ